MKLSEFKNELINISDLMFVLPNGELVPVHFHVTEVGNNEKNYIDCGGTIRKETVISFQLWEDRDVDHRLKAEKLLNIIALSEEKLGLPDEEIEVEYQAETIGKFGVEFSNGKFQLTNKFTDCLAKDKCGIPEPKKKIALSELQNSNCCTPNSGCC